MGKAHGFVKMQVMDGKKGVAENALRIRGLDGV